MFCRRSRSASGVCVSNPNPNPNTHTHTHLLVDKEVDHLALYLEAPVAVGLLDQADTPAH